MPSIATQAGEKLKSICITGWTHPDTAENTRRQLVEFRDALVSRSWIAVLPGRFHEPRYAFVHGNFALANAAGGYACGVDNEMQILADTGCYADFTLPAAAFHPAQIGKVNSLYECAFRWTLKLRTARAGIWRLGRAPQIFPLIVQGPLMLDFDRHARNRRWPLRECRYDGANPPGLRRLGLWKKARFLFGRPDWLFIKLHCHSMDPTQEEAVMGPPMQQFLAELVEGARRAGKRSFILSPPAKW